MRGHIVDPTTQELKPRRFYCTGCGHETEVLFINDDGTPQWQMTEWQDSGNGCYTLPLLEEHNCTTQKN